MVITLKNAEYLDGYRLRLTFNTGESGIVDLKGLVQHTPQAAPLRDLQAFQQFHLDEWPTIVWPCGFDLAPEYAYHLATGKSQDWEKA